LLSNFNDTAELTNTATATSIYGSSTVVFGLLNGVPVVAPQRPVRAQGGFFQRAFRYRGSFMQIRRVATRDGPSSCITATIRYSHVMHGDLADAALVAISFRRTFNTSGTRSDFAG
jgi:hypothetical protein